MRFACYDKNGKPGLAMKSGDAWHGLADGDAGYPGSLQSLIEAGGSALQDAAAVLADAPVVDMDSVTMLPPLSNPEKIVCVGLNYRDHTSESPYEQPDYPTIFGRFNSSLLPHGGTVIRPKVSEQLDYEGEMVAVIGKTASKVSEADALDYVIGYSIFNDVSVRDYQFLAPQWTPGKNFDASGPFGPDFVTADELPRGAEGLMLTTRLNGQVVQQASTSDMVFTVAQLVSFLSSFMTLKPGDLIVTGTPAGVGFARKPPLFMKDGDICEVEIERIGILSNPIRDEA
jgi:2-keto-4-pentenoate hydratase/2-oxohepta-3-ene-1,7-dioic acid hydratase in catechol pathway